MGPLNIIGLFAGSYSVGCGYHTETKSVSSSVLLHSRLMLEGRLELLIECIIFSFSYVYWYIFEEYSVQNMHTMVSDQLVLTDSCHFSLLPLLCVSIIQSHLHQLH